MKTRSLFLCCSLLLCTVGCGDPNGGTGDAGVDTGGRDSGPPGDSGPPRDSGRMPDGGRDSGPPRDSGLDAFVPDAFVPDAFVPDDAFMGDAGPCGVCDDGDPCNGAETCDLASETCVTGAPLVCNDTLDCTTDTCVVGTGCVATPTDGDSDGDDDCTDCAPADPTRFEGATEVCNMLDDNCNGATDEGVVSPLYADCDGDGWATETAVSFDSCPPPPVSDTGCGTAAQAWTTRIASPTDFDCADAEALAHSMTTAYRTTPATDITDPDVDFDYNCDYVEEPQLTATGSCIGAAGACATTAGWLATVPDCGEAATFIAGCTVACTASTESRTQGCR